LCAFPVSVPTAIVMRVCLTFRELPLPVGLLGRCAQDRSNSSAVLDLQETKHHNCYGGASSDGRESCSVSACCRFLARKGRPQLERPSLSPHAVSWTRYVSDHSRRSPSSSLRFSSLSPTKRLWVRASDKSNRSKAKIGPCCASTGTPAPSSSGAGWSDVSRQGSYSCWYNEGGVFVGMIIRSEQCLWLSIE